MKHFGGKEILLALAIFGITAAIIAYKVLVLEYTMTTIKPEDGYHVRLIMTVDGNGKDCSVKVALPLKNDRQIIKYETESSEGVFDYENSPNRIGRWSAEKFKDSTTISYTFFAQTVDQKSAIPAGVNIPDSYPEGEQAFLQATEKIQSDASDIIEKAYTLAPEGCDVETALQNIYNFCYTQIEFLNVRGPTKALTALKLQEASCNGKNRLMVALLRARGIPARMTNGLILENNRKRTTHAWTVAKVGEAWIPFCPTNGYFAEVPVNYLELTRGDIPVFLHSANIGFDWRFVIQHQLSHKEQAVLSNANNPMNILHTWMSLKDYHISLDLIMIILMIPIGATVVAISRNVVGLLPFGTFMPALIAVSFRDTGLLVGFLFFFVVIVVGSLTNAALIRLRLLHVPRLVIIITVVVMSILILSIVAIRLGFAQGAAVSLFPMAILSLTCERFTQTLLEDGARDAVRRMAVTFIVASACYFVYNIETLQILIVAFPELLLCNIAIALVIGSWTGMRLLEYVRYRGLTMVKKQG